MVPPLRYAPVADDKVEGSGADLGEWRGREAWQPVPRSEQLLLALVPDLIFRFLCGVEFDADKS